MLLSTNLTLLKNNSVMNLFLKEWGNNTAQQNSEFDSVLFGLCNLIKISSDKTQNIGSQGLVSQSA